MLRSRQHERGTSQERRYKRSHRRSPSSGRQHGHRDRDRDRAHLAHPTSSRRTRLHRHHGSSSASQERHRHRSPSTRSQVSPRDNTAHVLASILRVPFRHCIMYCAPRDTTTSSRFDHTPNPTKTYTIAEDAFVLCRTLIDDSLSGEVSFNKYSLYTKSLYLEFMSKKWQLCIIIYSFYSFVTQSYFFFFFFQIRI